MALLLLVSLNSCAKPKQSCSASWRITGYFTPIQQDYPGGKITVINISSLGERPFPESFLEAVAIEGWGKTNEGWYLGRYGNRWHRSPEPLDSLGNALDLGAVATDPGAIPKQSKLKISSLAGDLNQLVYTAVDVGSAVRGKHIDVYTGEGGEAEKLSKKISGEGHWVCILKQE